MSTEQSDDKKKDTNTNANTGSPNKDAIIRFLEDLYPEVKTAKDGK